MSDYIVAADILSFIFMLVMLFGALIMSRGKLKTSTKLFIALLAVVLVALPVDAFSYIAEELTENDHILRTLNLLSYSFLHAGALMFCFYMISVIREKTQASYRMLIPLVIISALNEILIIVGTINGQLFSIVDHRFQTGPWDSFEYVLTFIYVIYLCVILYKYRRELKARFILALSTYLIFPIILSAGVLLFDFLDFSYAAGTVSFLIIYISIQSQTIAEVELREKIANEVSYKDSLTGLKNRRSYTEALHCDDPDTGKGVAFFDLNYLKRTNDTYGHEAGDKLIKEFAGLLTESFSDGEVFRISGDEFVIMLHPADRDEMDGRMKAFRSIVDERDRMASFGYVYREKGDLIEMIREAEQDMYADKDKYYKETGRNRRRW